MCELQVVLDSLAWFVAIILMLGKGAQNDNMKSFTINILMPDKHGLHWCRGQLISKRIFKYKTSLNNKPRKGRVSIYNLHRATTFPDTQRLTSCTNCSYTRTHRIRTAVTMLRCNLYMTTDGKTHQSAWKFYFSK